VRKAPLVSLLDVDERVTLAWSVGWPDVFDLTGGNPVLVFRGDIAAGVEPPDGITDDAFFTRRPRSGIGVTRDGRVLLVTVDGRKQGYSVGMTHFRLIASSSLSCGRRRGCSRRCCSGEEGYEGRGPTGSRNPSATSAARCR